MVMVSSVASPGLFWSSSAGLDYLRLGAGGDLDPRGVLVQTSSWRRQLMVFPSMVKMTPSSPGNALCTQKRFQIKTGGILCGAR